MKTLSQLQPQVLWRYFDELCKIPRCSKKEQAVIAWLEKVARDHGVEALRDRGGNLLMRVPATRGREQAPVVALQSHVDMVCEKNSDVTHDFSRDPIRPLVDGELVRAQGTTLGADNGIGMAAALAFLDTPDAPHGPLELLFTVDEETGLSGALAVAPDLLRARFMLNLDSEEIGVFTVGCAGGRDTQIRVRAPRTERPALAPHTLTVSGLQGGHSGTDIHKNRGNSIKILGRLLLAAAEDAGVSPLHLGAASGGSKRNALPREASAELAVEPRRAAALKAAITAAGERVRLELAGIDAGLRIGLEPSTAGEYADASDSLRVLRLIQALPQGVAAMSVDLPTLVETSNNVGVLEELGDGYRLICATRSSVAPALEDLLARIDATARLAGAEPTHNDGYPGWKPNLDSPLLARALAVYEKLYASAGKVQAIHAGLECGLLTEKYPDLDILSYGPDIQGAHSPDERVDIATVVKMWDFTRALLNDLSRA
ncbi:MAG: aminoacyl-histidine dipeptidase [Candidatus Eisenbacteria bacterium]